MSRCWKLGWLCGVVVIASLLFGGIPVSGAQTGTSEDQTYIWQPYGLSLSYPSDWQVVVKGDVISVRPTDRDVSDGFGPELILFPLPDADPADLDAAVQDVAAMIGGIPGEIVAGRLDGRASRTFVYTRTDPDVTGGVTVVAVDDQTVIATAYVVRRDEPGSVVRTLPRITLSLSFESTVRETPPSVPSLSVASVQLPQPYTWDAAGLALYFPSDWHVSQTTSGDTTTLTAAPVDEAVTSDNRYDVIQASMLPKFSGLDLHTVAEAVAQDYSPVTGILDLTVAGYPAVTYDIVDTSETPVLYLRTVIVGMPERNALVLFVFGAEQGSWDSFRPLVSAFLSSIEQVDARAATAPASGIHVLAARVSPHAEASRWQDDGGGTRPFVWADYGVTFEIPDAWQTVSGGQDFDLALVSPAAMQSSSGGSFVVVRSLPSVGAGETMASALQPVADQVSGTVEPFTANGLEGAAVNFEDTEAGTMNHLVLLPYGTQGAALYIQTTAVPEEDASVLAILGSITIDPPVPDYAAIDAAWQTSLAEQGRLLYGDPAAPVKMVEFFDFSCGHCASYSADVERLIALDVEPGDLYLELAPLDTIGGSLSNAVSQATYCATEQGKGYTAYETLFHGYMTEGYDVAYTRDGITSLLSQPEIGVDVDALNACIDAGTYADVIVATDQRATDAGVTGTPSVLLAAGDAEPAFVNLPSGDRWTGAIPLDVLRPVIKDVKDNEVSVPDALANFFGSQ